MNHEEEIQKCKDDPVYFYEKYFIVNGEKPILTDSQKHHLRMVVEAHKQKKKVIVVKGRRSFTVLAHKILTADINKHVLREKS